MDAGFAIDGVVLLGAVLLGLGVLAGVAAGRLRVPGLLAFLALGMVVADDGLAIVRFDDVDLAQDVAVVALAVILFEGGLATSPGAVRRALVPAGLLGTVGVVVTAAVVAAVAALALGFPWQTAWLLGSVIASTDAAAVFGALRDRALPDRLKELLQVESGGNDPVAVMLTIGMVEAWRDDVGAGSWVAFGAVQLAGGLVVGAAVGALATWGFARIRLPSASTYAVLALAVGGVAYGLAAVAGASGFLAVYVAGVALGGNRRFLRPLRAFHEALATTAQAALFLILGLLVFPSDLPPVAGDALVVAAALVLLARPLAVLVCVPWFGFRPAEVALVAWAGLRGAVPVVLATIPLTAGHPDGRLVFNLVFVVVLVSLALQATTVSALAERLGLEADVPAAAFAEIVPVDSLQADVAELHLGDGARVVGHRLADVPLPGSARIAVAVRGEAAFVPDGDTVLQTGDTLLVVLAPGSDPAGLVAWGGSATT